MTIKAQELDVFGKTMVVLPKKQWDSVLEELEELDDIRAYDEAVAYKKAHPDEECYTLEEVKRMTAKVLA